jgi:hypothetical protein
MKLASLKSMNTKNEFEECTKQAICKVCGVEYKCLQVHIFNKHEKRGHNHCAKCLDKIAKKQRVPSLFDNEDES